MTLDEQKLAVCEKLPKVFRVTKYVDDKGRPYGNIYWILGDRMVCWPTEGLQVCHEAEKLLAPAERMVYGEQMWQLATGDLLDYSGVYYEGESPGIDYKELYPIANATYEQRLEALCRVWWPEKF